MMTNGRERGSRDCSGPLVLHLVVRRPNRHRVSLHARLRVGKNQSNYGAAFRRRMDAGRGRIQTPDRPAVRRGPACVPFTITARSRHADGNARRRWIVDIVEPGAGARLLLRWTALVSRKPVACWLPHGDACLGEASDDAVRSTLHAVCGAARRGNTPPDTNKQ
jgi:hypothetical protein